MSKLQIKSAIQILKPVDQVFNAVIEPEKMSNYFISESSGKIEEGKTINWKFPEFEATYPVRVDKVEENKLISFYWDNEGVETLVKIFFEEKNNSTLVNIEEGEMENDEAGIKWLKNNTGGWANFLASLKAYVEHGINLRKGAFDFMRKS